MADPRPLTRNELAQFLPSQRAIRAFERLFELVPDDLTQILVIAEEALSAAANARAENLQLKQELERLQLELQIKQSPNLDSIIKRIELLETLGA